MYEHVVDRGVRVPGVVALADDFEVPDNQTRGGEDRVDVVQKGACGVGGVPLWIKRRGDPMLVHVHSGDVRDLGFQALANALMMKLRMANKR